MTNLKVLGVVLGTLAVYTWVANSIPQLESVVPEELSFGADVGWAGTLQRWWRLPRMPRPANACPEPAH